jgi:hypothetical protein
VRRPGSRHGRAELGGLFDETAREAYFDQFAKEAELAGLIGTEAENLHDLIRQERRDGDEVHRAFAEQADAAEAASCFRKVGEQERARQERLLAPMRKLAECELRSRPFSTAVLYDDLVGWAAQSLQGRHAGDPHRRRSPRSRPVRAARPASGWPPRPHPTIQASPSGSSA